MKIVGHFCNLFPSRPESPVSFPDLEDSDINGLQRPYNDVAQNYRTNDPPRRFISGPHKIKRPFSGGSAPAPQTQGDPHDPALTHNAQTPLTHSGLQGPLIQDLNMVALQQQQQQVLVKPMKPLSRLKSSSTKATTTTTTTKVVPTFWFNTTKAPSTTITTTTSTTPTTGRKDQLETFGVGSDFKYPAAWKNKIPRFPYVPLPKVLHIIRLFFFLKTDQTSYCCRM